MISEQLNDVSSINNKAFNLFIDRIYYLLQNFIGHLKRHNSFFLILSDARTIYSLKIIV